MSTKTYRRSFALRKASEEHLKWITETEGLTPTEAIDKALAFYARLQKIRDDGQSLVLEDKNGKQKHLEFL